MTPRLIAVPAATTARAVRAASRAVIVPLLLVAGIGPAGVAAAPGDASSSATPSAPRPASSPAAGTRPTAAASAASAAAPMSAAKRRQLDRVLGLQQPAVEAAARGLVEQSLTGVVQGGRQLLATQVAPERRDPTARMMDIEVRRYRDDVTPIVMANAQRLSAPVLGPLLAATFSEDELRRLADWLDSPLNRKYQALVPQLQEAFLQQLLADSRGELEPRLNALGERLARLVGMPSAAASAPSSPASAGR